MSNDDADAYPLGRTGPRLRWLRAAAAGEFAVVLIGGRWYPADVPGAADTWFMDPQVQPLWTSRRQHVVVVGEKYPMDVTLAGARLLDQWERRRRE